MFAGFALMANPSSNGDEVFGRRHERKRERESENETDNPPDVGRVVQMARHGAKTESDGGNRRNRERRRTADDSYASDARLPDEKIN